VDVMTFCSCQVLTLRQGDWVIESGSGKSVAVFAVR